MLPEPDGKGFFVKVRSDVRLHVVTTGPADGVPVILLHGFPEFWWSWRHQLSFLAEHGFRAIAPDLRGFNHSDKPQRPYDAETLTCDIVELMNALDIESAAVAGNDLGGFVAFTMALLYPQRVRNLIILNTLHPARWPSLRINGKVGIKIFVRLARTGHWLGNPLMAAINEVVGLGRVMRWLAYNKTAFPKPVRRADSQAYGRGASTATAHARDTAVWLAHHLPDDLYVQRPLIMWSENDLTAPLRWITRDITQTVAEADLVFVPKAGHWVQQENPEFVNAQMLRFLSEQGVG